MRRLAHKVLGFIRERALVRAGGRVGVAVSGGLDSVALLRLLLELRGELGLVLSIVHFNHKLRGAESDADERFADELARAHGVPFHRGEGEVRGLAESGLGMEAAARKLRYEFFAGLLRDRALDSIATAHTLDDQAETVLLRIARGAGTRGLAGIYPRLGLFHDQQLDRLRDSDRESAAPRRPSIIRPLLGVRRTELESYLAEIKQDWREDSSNRDLHHARNRVRRELVPWLQQNLNPAVGERLAETAEIAREEEEYWRRQVETAVKEVWIPAENAFNIRRLASLPLALRRRAVRAAGESLGLRLTFEHVQEILEVSNAPSAGAARSAALSAGWMVSRDRGRLRFGRRETSSSGDYEYRLAIPGKVAVREAGALFEAALIAEHGGTAYDPENLLDPGLLAKELLVRNWRAGDRFWPSHGKGPRKVKELLQRRHVSGSARLSWPVIASGGDVVWMRGFGAAHSCRLNGGSRPAMVIRETEL